MKFNATVEILTGQKAAIVTLFDLSGEWSGSGRIDLPRSSNPDHDLYEHGYVTACQSAACKGGTVETYRQVAA